jgi:protein-L-isoaspartate(D-aspartate) O-methyltransferase
MSSSRPGFPARLPAQSLVNAKAGRALAHAESIKPKSTLTGENTAHVAINSIASGPRLRTFAPMPDYASSRAALVRRLREQGVADEAVLAAIANVQRHHFVDSALAGQAYEDTSLPIGLGQTISKPSVVARMMELLRAGREGRLGRVLEIGTGCGYQAAVLSVVAQEVYSIERLRGLHERARENLRNFRLANLHLLFGDGMLGYPKGAPYAGIIAAAGGEAIPQAWVEQLAVGARIVAPMVTQAGAQALMVLEKTPTGVTHSVLEAVHFVPLKSGVA